MSSGSMPDMRSVKERIEFAKSANRLSKLAGINNFISEEFIPIRGNSGKAAIPIENYIMSGSIHIGITGTSGIAGTHGITGTSGVAGTCGTGYTAANQNNRYYTKSDLLKEAIADAKAIRETALANAKLIMEVEDRINILETHKDINKETNIFKDIILVNDNK